MEKTKLWRKDFTLVVIGQIISLFGNAILRFALPLYLLRETGSAALFGLVTACSFLPMIVLSFLGGVLADRVNKRNIMVMLDFLTSGVIIALFVALGRLPIVPLFIAALMLLYGISGTYQPTVQASIPVLVSADNVLSAGAVVNQISSLASLLGPIVGGMLFGAFGIVPILIISIVCFLFSAIMEIFITIPFVKRKTSSGVWEIIKSDFRDSASYLIREKPALIKVIGIVSVFNLLLTSMLIVGLTVIMVETLQVSDAMLGIAQGLLALGGLCGGIVTAMLGKRLRFEKAHRLLLFDGLCVGVMAIPLLLGAPQMLSYAVIAAASFILMSFATMFSIQALAVMQLETPPELVGKVIALMIALSNITQPIGQAVYGLMFGWFPHGHGVILLVVAMLGVVLSLSARGVFKAFAK